MGNGSRRGRTSGRAFKEPGNPMSIGDAPAMGVRAFGAATKGRRWFVVAMFAAVVALPFVGAALAVWL